jgi:hypothetical protein
MADSIEQVVYEYLTADTTFAAKFKGIYWQEAEATTSPYIVFWMVDDAGIESRLSKSYQGEARIQFDLWDTNKIRGAKLRTALREKVRDLNEVRSGYKVNTIGITEQTIQRESTTDPFHFVVDGIIKWNEE